MSGKLARGGTVRRHSFVGTGNVLKDLEASNYMAWQSIVSKLHATTHYQIVKSVHDLHSFENEIGLNRKSVQSPSIIS